MHRVECGLLLQTSWRRVVCLSAERTNEPRKTVCKHLLACVQVGVGEDLSRSGLRAMASANESYTVLIESNWTLLADQLVDKLTDISCNSESVMSFTSQSCLHIMARNKRHEKGVYSKWLNSGQQGFHVTYTGGIDQPGTVPDRFDICDLEWVSLNGWLMASDRHQWISIHVYNFSSNRDSVSRWEIVTKSFLTLERFRRFRWLQLYGRAGQWV